jgi:hypothetical protein
MYPEYHVSICVSSAGLQSEDAFKRLKALIDGSGTG